MGGRGSKGPRKHAGQNCRTAPNPDKFLQASGDDTGVKIGKQVIDFHNEQVTPLETPITDTVEIKNNNSYSIKFSFEPCFQREFQLTFTPSSGTIKARSAKVIKARLNVHLKVNINFRVTLNIEGVGSHFIIAKIRCETGVFGVDPAGLPMREDDRGRRIPDVLLQLKAAFMERGGLEQEGVFRLAGEQTELKLIKQRMNAGDMSMPADVNTIATLVKIWYRELPQPVLNYLPNERILYSGEVQDCVDAVATLPEMQKVLLDWLLDLLLLVAENRRVNKMTAQNLAIVVAPNLYEATTSDPMEGLVMSQKAVQFIHNVLVDKIRTRERVLGHALDAEFAQEELAPQPFGKDGVPIKPVLTQTQSQLRMAGAAAPAAPPASSVVASATVAQENADAPLIEKNDTEHPSSQGGEKRRRHHKHRGGKKRLEDSDPLADEDDSADA